MIKHKAPEALPRTTRVPVTTVPERDERDAPPAKIDVVRPPEERIHVRIEMTLQTVLIPRAGSENEEIAAPEILRRGALRPYHIHLKAEGGGRRAAQIRSQHLRDVLGIPARRGVEDVALRHGIIVRQGKRREMHLKTTESQLP